MKAILDQIALLKYDSRPGIFRLRVSSSIAKRVNFAIQKSYLLQLRHPEVLPPILHEYPLESHRQGRACSSWPDPRPRPSRDDASLVESKHFCFATYREVHIALISMVTLGQDEDYEKSQLPKLWIETDFLSPTNFCSSCGDDSDTRNDCEVSAEEYKDVSFCGFCSVPGRLPPGRFLLVSLCRCSPRPPTLRALTYPRSSTMSSFATSTQRDTEAVTSDVSGLSFLSELLKPPTSRVHGLKAFDSTLFPLVPLTLKLSGYDLDYHIMQEFQIVGTTAFHIQACLHVIFRDASIPRSVGIRSHTRGQLILNRSFFTSLNEHDDYAYQSYMKTLGSCCTGQKCEKTSNSTSRPVTAVRSTSPIDRSPSTTQLMPIHDSPWESISLDFVINLPKRKGYDSILVVICYLYKMAHFIPTQAVAELFIENVFKLHGLLKIII